MIRILTCRVRMQIFLYMLLLIGVASCAPEEEKEFTLLPSSHTNVDFVNKIKDTREFNVLNYLYFYDGGGVAVGDINNNGLPDIFFVGNEVENRLYLNKGDFKFEDITESAGVAGKAGSWSTGVTMADINGNGYLDIYVSQVTFLNKEGPNQLFINNGNETFTEKAAEYNLDFAGYSTQAAFFDYNNNGRLDLFLLNHSFHSELSFGQADYLRQFNVHKAGDKLYRNDGDTFTDVTEEVGIHSSALGYGLGVAISDINKNGWPDIYVGNDFHEDDYLYINNGDGTFTESLYSSIRHTSRSSMGNDIADITNNGNVDIISLDMMPEDHEIYMRSGGPDLYQTHQSMLNLGFGHKHANNTLQLNRGVTKKGTPLFSEIAFVSGVAKTDWSWASLIMDLNNNGLKDLFITNGMGRRPNDLDFARMTGDRESLAPLESITEEELALIDDMPQLKIPNYAFQNNGDLTFTNKAEEWGLNQPSFSSGAAYADLNNNGRLDLVVNNVNMPAFIYKNNTPEADSAANYLKVKLMGEEMNTSGIGSKVILYKDEQLFYQEQMPTRGFKSSVDHVLHFGLGSFDQLDSLVVIWPNQKFESLYNIESNQQLLIDQRNAGGVFDYTKLNRSWDESYFQNISEEIGLEYSHQEDHSNDYSRDPLMPYKLSTQGPALAVGDVTGNGLDDFYIGGARFQSGRLFLQESDREFILSNSDLFKEDIHSEDVDAVFFDATGNGLPDLYVVSGGGELTGNAPALKDRLYINEGNGIFSKSVNRLPEFYTNGSVVCAGDFNNNGHQDLFIGGRSLPFQYGISPQSYLLENDGQGNFQDVTDDIAPELRNIGMVTDAKWEYITHQQFPDLIIAGEWMPIQLYRYNGTMLTDQTQETGLANSNGLWQSLLITDLNSSGSMDIIAGNFGINSRIQASQKAPFRLYINDFNDDGRTTPVMARYLNGEYYPFEQLDELLLDLPFLGEVIHSYEQYASYTMTDLFGRQAIASSITREVTELKSLIFINRGDGSFEKRELLPEVQFSPVMAIEVIQSDENDSREILFGGNLFDVRLSIGGRQDASYGNHIISNSDGFNALDLQSSGFFINGEVRNIKQLKTSNGDLILVARNNNELKIFQVNY